MHHVAVGVLGKVGLAGLVCTALGCSVDVDKLHGRRPTTDAAPDLLATIDLQSPSWDADAMQPDVPIDRSAYDVPDDIAGVSGDLLQTVDVATNDVVSRAETQGGPDGGLDGEAVDVSAWPDGSDDTGGDTDPEAGSADVADPGEDATRADGRSRDFGRREDGSGSDLRDGSARPDGPTGTITHFSLSTANAQPWTITVGPDGNLWFTERGGNKIGRITPAGVIDEFGLPRIGSSPHSIVTGPDGNLWFTESDGNRIGCMSPSGEVLSEYPLPSPGGPYPGSGGSPAGITAGPDGALWFAEYGGGKIGRIATDGTISERTIPTANSSPVRIISGPDGNLWFTENGGNRLGTISTTLTIAEQPWLGNNTVPYDLVEGPDGYLWFTQMSANRIARVAFSTSGTVTTYSITSTPGSQPTGITLGPDGNLWFTEYGAGKIGRITPAGVITEWSLGSSTSAPLSIVTGPDGCLWFTESGSNRIGRIIP